VGQVEGLAEVALLNGDSAVAYYAPQQPDDPSEPLLPDVASTPVAGPSAATAQFSIPKASSVNMLPGLGQTVRIEITRAGGSKETYYLFDEYDLLDRGFPSEGSSLNLP